MFVFQAAELLAVTLLSPGNLPENLQTSKPVRKSSSSLDMISFWGTLLSVISQQQLKANNYNLLVTPATFFSLVLNGSPLTLNANFTKKKIYFSNFIFFLKQELCFFSSLLSPNFFFKKITWLTCWRKSQVQAKFRRVKPAQVPALQCTPLSQGPTHFIPWAPGGLWFARGAQHLIHMAIF